MQSLLKTTAYIVNFILLFEAVVFPFSYSTAQAQVAFTRQINYQGKLTDTVGGVVADGNYNLRFKLYTSATGGSPIWTETWCYSPNAGITCNGTGVNNRPALVNGLFSVMLGSTTALTSINFNQPLYLGVEVGGTGTTPTWDGEMSPRKRLGTVPSAFEAENAQTVGGVASSSLLRSNTSDAYTSGTLTFDSGTSLVVNGNATFARATTTNATTTHLYIGTDVWLNGERFTDLTGTGLKNTAGALQVDDTVFLSLSNWFATTTDALDEGSSNLYFTNARVAAYINASSTIPHVAGGAFGNILRWSGSAWQSVATSTLRIAIGDTTGTLSVARGGTGATTLTGVLKGNGTSAFTAMTGTANYVTRWTDANTLGTGVLYDNGTNVGIGTTTPIDKLFVYGGDVSVGKSSNTSFTGTRIYTGGVERAQVLANIDSTDGGKLVFYTKASGGSITEAARFDQAGRMSIGVGATPSGRLHVAGSGNVLFMNSGNTGIGTTSPYAKLSVAGHVVGAYFTATTTSTSTLPRTNITRLTLGGDYVTDITGTGLSVSSGSLNVSAVPASALSLTQGYTYVGNASNVASATSTLFISTAKNVGVGTTVPAAKLQIQGSGGIGQSVMIDNRELKFRGDGDAHYSIFANRIAGTLTIEETSANGDVGYAGSVRLAIQKTTGYVGIGTDTPLSKLDVVGGSLGVRSSTLTNGSIYINPGGSDYAGYIDFYKAGPTRIAYLGYKDGGSGNLGLNLENSASFNINGGNVGIGTTSPTALLHVRKDQNEGTKSRVVNLSSGTNAFSQFSVDALGASLYNYAIGSGYTTAGRYVAASGALDAVGAGGLSISASDGSGVIRFYTAGDNERLRITSTGNVGIGTTSPYAKLSVAGHVVGAYFTATTTSTSTLPRTNITRLTLGGDYVTDITGTGLSVSSGSLNVSAVPASALSLTQGYTYVGNASNVASATSTLFMSSASRVGIKQTSPGTTLDVGASTLDTIRSYGGFVGHASANIDGTGAAAYFPNGLYSNAATSWIYGNVYFSAGASVIQSDGDVGIGTTNPTGRFSIVSADSPYMFTVSGASKGVRFEGNSTGVILSGVDNTLASSYQPLYMNGSYLGFQNSTTEVMRITGNKVGIGTTNPNYKLTVSAGDQDGISVVSSGTARMEFNPDGGGAVVFNNADANGFYFNQNGTTRVTFDGSGKVGIGTAAPDTILHISSATPVLRIDASNNNVDSTLQFLGRDSNSGQTSKVQFVQGVTETVSGIGATLNILTTKESSGGSTFTSSMFINKLGNVGIATTAPAYKMDVNGYINTSGITGGYKMQGNTVLYASTTNTSLAVGASSAAAWMRASSSQKYSIAMGYQALAATPTGNPTKNTALGFYALSANTSGTQNTSIGANTLQQNTTGSYNTAAGVLSQYANTTGSYNTSYGYASLFSNTTGTDNTALGFQSLYYNTSGVHNTAVGQNTLLSNTTGSYNSAFGLQALQSNTSGIHNTSIGRTSMYLNTSGSYNAALGMYALYYNTSATTSTAIGWGAGQGSTNYSNTGGTYVGYAAGYNLGNASNYNTLIGLQTGFGITTGARNTVIGNSTIAASYNQITTGSNNIAIGNDVAVPSATASNQLVIGNLIYGTGLSGTGSTVSTGSIGIGIVNPTGKLQVVGDEVRVGDSGSVDIATADGDLFVEDDLEVDGEIYASTILSGDTNLVPNWQFESDGAWPDPADTVETTFIDGESIKAHRSVESGTGCYGWGHSPTFLVNPTKTYEFSVWIKSTENDMNNYFGFFAYDASGTQISTSPFDNPYFRGDENDPNEWHRWSGYIMPSYSDDNANGFPDAGDSPQTRGVDYSWPSNTVSAKVRFGSCYGDGSNTGLSYFAYPQVKEIQPDKRFVEGDHTIYGDLVVGQSGATNKVDIASGTRSATHASGLPLYVTGDIGAASSGIEFRHSNGSQGIGFGYNTIYATGSNSSQELNFTTKGTSGMHFQIGGNTKMAINGTTGNVGIGTTTPGVKLDVVGSIRAYSNALNNATIDQTKIAFINTTNTAAFDVGLLGGTSDAIAYLYNRANAAMIFGTNNSSRMTIDGSGNVGIGTTNPGQKLEVTGNTTITGTLRVGASTGGSGTAGDIVARRSATTGAYYFGDSTSNYLYFDGTNYIFGLGGLYVNTNGNVGIGNTSPSQKLDVVGNIKSTGYGIFPTGIAPAVTGAPDGKIFSPSGDYLGATTWGINYNEGTPDYIEFNNASGATSRIALDDGSAHFALSGGSVGIGTTAPGSKLVVSGGNVTIAPTGSEIAAGYNPLYVNAPVASSVTTDEEVSTAGINIRGYGDNVNLQLGVGGSALNYSGWIQASYDNGGTGGVEPLLLNPAGGNVGIGTTSPTKKLSTYHTGSQNGIEIAGYVPTLYFRNVGYTGDHYHISVAETGTNSTFAIKNETDGTYPFAIDGAGKVGILNSSPTYSLDVSGTGRFTDDLYMESGLKRENNSLDDTDSSLYMQYYSSGGGVVIGDSGVDHDLTVYGTGTFNEYIYLPDSNTRLSEGAGNALRMQTNSGYIDIGAQNTSYAHIYTDRPAFYTNAPVRVQGSLSVGSATYAGTDAPTNGAIIEGNVGIGTTNPASFKLQVAGNVGPETDATYDLGSSAKRWNNLYLTNAPIIGGYHDLTNDNLLSNGDFETGTFTGWTASGTTGVVSAGAYAGNYSAQSTGNQTVLSDDYIPVDPDYDVLQLEGWFKETTTGSPTPGVLYFGYIAYDESKVAITTSPCGTYCYFAASGYNIPNDGAWHKFSATTNGEGTSYPNFPVGTKYVRVLMLMNYAASSNEVTRFDHVTLKRVNNGPLFVGNNFSTTNLADQNQATKLYTTASNNFVIEPPSSGKVGIGTASPRQKLEVIGISQISYADGGNDFLTIQPYTDGYTYFNSHGDGAGEGGFRFRTNDGAAESMVITHSGYVGIGTTGPGNLLSVNQAGNATVGTGTTYGIALYNQGTLNAGLGSDASSVFLQSWAGKPLHINNQGNNTILNYGGGGVAIGALSSPSYTLDVRGDTRTSRLRLLGEGTDSGQSNCYYCMYQEGGAWSSPYPDLRIQFHTGIKMEAYHAYGGIKMYNGYDGSGNPAGLAFSVGDGDQTVRSYQNFYAPIVYDQDNASYYLDSSASGTSLNTAGAIYAGADVIVGNQIVLSQANGTDNGSPSITPFATDDFSYDGDYLSHYGFGFYSNSGSGGTHAYMNGYYGLDFFTSGTNRMRIRSDGNIGIGTVAPSAKLTIITSSDSAPSTISAYDARHISVGPSVSDAIAFSKTTGGSSYITSLRPGVAWDPLAIQASTFTFNPGGGTSSFYINSSGNIGIGTTGQQEKVQIFKDGTPAEGNFGLSILSASADSELALGASASGDYSYIQSFSDGVSWTNRPLILQPNGGAVTIGAVANPRTNTVLDVAGGIGMGRLGTFGTYNSSQIQGIWSISPDYLISTGSNNGGNAYGMAYSYDSNGVGISGYGHQIVFVGNGTRYASIGVDSGHAYFAGNVGIGTTAPGVKLDVVGNIAVSGSNGNSIYTWTNSDTNWRMGMSNSPGFTRALATTHTSYVTYSNGAGQGFAVGVNGGNSSFEVAGSDHTAYFRGNVGLGTAAPESKLEVNGGALTMQRDNVLHYRNVVHYRVNAPDQPGTMQIEMPKLWSDTMITVTIKGYDYDASAVGAGAWEVVVSGYNYGAGPYWVNTSAEIRGNAPFTQVRLARNGSKNVILLGDTSTDWDYPQVAVTDVVAGYSSQTGWGSGWSISLLSSEASISVVTTPNLNMGRFADGSASAPTLSFFTDTNTGIYRPGSDIIGFTTGGTERLRLDGSGNLTFSGANPTIQSGGSYFVIPNGVYFSGGTSYFQTNTNFRANIQNDTAAYLTIAGGTSGNTYFSGNVGINTSAPSVKLHVNAGAAEAIRIQGTAAYMSFYDTAGSDRFGYIQHTGSNLALVNEEAGILSFYTSNTERARFDSSGNLIFNRVGIGAVGSYDATKTQAVWSMGSSYVLPPDGGTTSYGTLYGLGWSYNPDYGGAGNNPQSKAGLNHQLLLMMNGVTYTALGNGIWTAGKITTTGGIASSGGTVLSNYAGSGDIWLPYTDGNSYLRSPTNWVTNTIRAENGNWYLPNSGSAYFNQGSMGIGTTSPVSTLEVSRTSQDSNSVNSYGFNVTNGNGKIGMGYDLADNMAYIQSYRYLVSWNNLVINPHGGNVGVGTISPNQGKVEVMGGSVCVDTNSDANASSCIANESDVRLKKNIETLSASSSLATLLTLNPVTFDWRVDDPEVLSHYPLISRFASSTHSVGLIAQEVLEAYPLAMGTETVGDSEVQYFQLDYEKFIPLIISGVKELAIRVNTFGDTLTTLTGKVDELALAVTTLTTKVEEGVIASGNVISSGLSQFSALWVGEIAVGTSEKPTGITMYDEVTGEPYCFKIREGQIATTLGVCSTIPTDEDMDTDADTEAPIIVIMGNNPAQISIGETYNDLGVTVTDNINPNVGYTVFVDGVEVSNIMLDTSVERTYEIKYVAEDQAGNIGTATRTVIIAPIENTPQEDTEVSDEGDVPEGTPSE